MVLPRRVDSLLDAEQLILEGFFGEVLELTPDEAIMKDLKSKITKKFARSQTEETKRRLDEKESSSLQAPEPEKRYEVDIG